MKSKKVVLAVGAGVLLYLLLRRKAAAATSTAATSTGFSPIGIASIYFDPGTDFTVNANVNSPSYGQTLY